MNVLTFERIQLSDIDSGLNFAVPVNLSFDGAYPARDWIHAPSNTSAGIVTPIRKTGANLLVLSILGADQGFGASQVPFAFTWSDGPTGSNSYAHVSQTQTVGNGYQVTCPVPVWPEWSVLKFWDYAQSNRMTVYDASMDDAAAVTKIDAIGGSSIAVDEPTRYGGGYNNSRLTSVRFSSQEPGKTLTFRARRNGTSMGNFNFFAVGLYKGAPSSSYPRGANNALTHSGKFAPLSLDGIDFV